VFIKEKKRGFNKIVLFNKFMYDMMHDDMTMHKRKEQTNLIGVLPGVVTMMCSISSGRRLTRSRLDGGSAQSGSTFLRELSGSASI
jgi:hypothetical protein